MDIIKIKNNIQNIVKLLVTGNFNEIYENDFLKEISSNQLKMLINDYKQVFTYPPESAFEKMIIYTISDTELTLDFDLWCNNEKSDVTLICRFKIIDNKLRYSIEDIHVL